MKENRKKKLLSLFLIAVMLVTGLPTAGAKAMDYDDVEQYTEGNYTYTVENGEAIIINCDKGISGDVVIPSELGGYPVTEIWCNTSSIYCHAFYRCKEITSITIPDSIKNIDYESFSYCTNLEKITVSENNPVYHSTGNCLIKTKERELVIGCKSSIIPSDGSVTCIGFCAFEGCIGLTNITIPDSVTSFGHFAFNGCRGLTDVVLPKNIKNIGAYAFSGCSNLVDITIPNGVTDITEGAFSACRNLQTISIPNSVTSIGKMAFASCEKLTRIIVPDSVMSIGEGAFSNCTALTTINLPYGITVIEDYMFSSCLSLETLKIPDSVTSIGEYAFMECTNLKSIIIPESVTAIGFEAFYWCTSLSNISIPNSIESVADGAFYNTAWYNSQPDGDVYIGKVYYEYKGEMPKNTRVVIKDGTKVIAAHAFKDCVNLSSVIISDGVTNIGYYAFSGCTNLTNISIPNSITRIETAAFNDCYALANIFIPDNVTRIERFAFHNTAFYNNPSNWENEVLYLGNHVIVSKESISDICKIRNGIKYIDPYAFYECNDLNGVIIPDGVIAIGENAFSPCKNLTKVEIPKSVTSIGDDAFGYAEYGKKAENYIIYGYRNTVAEEYAKKHELNFYYLNEKTVKDNTTGISISYSNDVYGDDIQLNVSVVTYGNAFNILNAERGNYKNALFDITTVVDGEKVQPNGTVFVKIPLLEGFNAEKTFVYHITNDGKLEKVECKVENGYIIFETTHFSYYAIVDESSSVNPSQNCSCNCHKKGIAKFIFKLILVFQKIFKKNKVCKCGINHY